MAVSSSMITAASTVRNENHRGRALHNARYSRRPVLAAALSPCLAMMGLSISTASAATDIFTTGVNGNLTVSANYTPTTTVPANGDTIQIGASAATGQASTGMINYTSTDTAITSLATLSLNPTNTPSSTYQFNQNAGALTTLAIGTLNVDSTAGGNTANGDYNLLSGTLNVSSGISFGAGNASSFIQTGGVANLTASGSASVGTSSGANSFYNISAGTFNANSLGTLYLGNGGNGNILLSGTATFNETAGTLVLGQYTNGTTGEFTISGSATANIAKIVIGGQNSASSVNGVINLNGGTVYTGGIQRGIGSNLTGSATNDVVNASGGTIVVTTNSVNSNFFLNSYVNLLAGGLTFNTGGNAVTTTNVINGTGPFTKAGAGTLTLSGASTYSGLTTVNGGTLLLTGSLPATSGVNVSSGAILTGNGSIGSLLVITGAGTALMTGAGTNTLTASALNLGDANSYGTADSAILKFNASSSAFEPITVTNVLALNNSGAYVSISGLLPIGNYTLVKYGSLTETPTAGSTFSLSPTTPGVETVNVGRQSYSLAAGTNSLVLTIGGAPIPAVAYFDGAVSNVWNDTTTSASLVNFSTDAAGATDAGNVPGSATDVILDASTKSGVAVISTLGASTTINSLTVNSVATSNTIAADGSVLTINGLADTNTASDGSYTGNTAGNGITILAGSGPVTIAVPIVLGGSQRWTNAGSSTFNVSGGISASATGQILTLSDTGSGNINITSPINNGTGTLGLNVNSSGSGVVVLSAINTYTGTTTVAAGTLQLNPGSLISPSATLNVGTIVGANASLNITGGNINQSGALQIATAANLVASVNISSGTYTYTNNNSIQIGSSAGSTASLVMTGGVFNSSSTASMYVDNAGAGITTGLITLSNNAVLNEPSTTLVLGQYGDTTTSANTSTATLTMSGSSVLNVSSIVLGCPNNAAYENGMISLNGGTISTSLVRRGNSYIATSPTAMVLNANGGTVLATAASTNFFNGVYVNLASGGLSFNTGNNAITIANSLYGTGGLAKTGTGTLTLSGSSSYTGGTQVKGGTLYVTNSTGVGTGSVTLFNATTLTFPITPASFSPYTVQTGFTGFTSNGNSATNGTPNPVISSDGTSVQLTTTANGEATSVFSPATVSFNDAGGFTASFTYTHTNLGNGADGVAFVIQNQSGGAYGAGGNGIGFSGINTSLGSIVNVYGNTIGYGLNGVVTANTPAAGISPNATSAVTVVYSEVPQTLTETLSDASGVYVSTLTNIDLATQLGETAGGTVTGYIGFTGATGGVNDNQTVSNFTFNASNITYGALPVTNPVIVASTASATLQLSPTANYSSGNVGPITINSGSTLIVSIGANAATGVVRGILTTPLITFTNASSGTVDIRGNALDITAQSLSSVNAMVATAYNSGTWTGPGITSSLATSTISHLTAVGVIGNTENGVQIYGTGGAVATFEGVSPGAADVLVKYTFYGDTDLNGSIDGTDYSRIDAAYLADRSNATAYTGWYNGDFNYDGVINGSDYTLMDNAYDSQGAALSVQVASATSLVEGGSAVPEPTTLGLLGMGAVALLGRRRPARRGR